MLQRLADALFARLLGSTGDRRIAAGILLVGTFVVATKLVAAAKEIVIARAFGVGAAVDGYLLAFTVATWAPATLTAALTAVIVPTLVRLAGDAPSERRRFQSELTGAALVAALVLAALTAPVLLQFERLTGFAVPGSAAWWFIPLGPLTLLAGVASLRIMAAGSHANTLLEAVPPLVLLIVLLVALAPLGPLALFVGTCLGALAHLIALVAASRDQPREPLLGPARFTFGSPAWRAIAAGGLAMAAGQFINALATPLDQYFAARAGEGSVSTLGYATRVASLFLGVGAVALSRATLPVFAGKAMGDGDRLWPQARKWALGSAVGGLAIALVVSLASPWIIALLFERGAFTARDTEAVAAVLVALAFQFPFYFAGMVLVSYLSVRQAYRGIAAIALVAVIAKALALLWLGVGRGALGVAYSTVVMYAASFAGLMWLGVRAAKANE